MSQLVRPASRTVLTFSSLVAGAWLLASCSGESQGGGSGGSMGLGGSQALAGRNSGGSSGSGGSEASGEKGGTSSTGGAADATKHPAWRVREALCDWTRACCETAGFFDGIVDHCLAQAPRDADQYRASIAAGRLSLDDDALRSCADHIRSRYLGCDSLPSALDSFATFSDCVDGIAGHVPIGAACTLGEDCVGGGSGRVECIDGLCADGAARIPDGSACTRDDRCGANSYCDGTCRTKKPLGAVCTSGHECAGLHCNQATGTCAELPDQAECKG